MLILLRLLFCFTLSLSEQQKCSYNGITTKPGYVHTYICIAVCIYIQTSKRIYSYWAVSIILEWNKSNKKKHFVFQTPATFPPNIENWTLHHIFISCPHVPLFFLPVPLQCSVEHLFVSNWIPVLMVRSLSLLRSLLLCYTITLCWLASLIQKPTEWSI